MPVIGELRARRERILAIARRHGARQVRIFGSTVRGTARADSDVDFLIALDEDRSLLDLIGMQDDLQCELGCPVDVVVEGGINRHLEQAILAEAVLL